MYVLGHEKFKSELDFEQHVTVSLFLTNINNFRLILLFYARTSGANLGPPEFDCLILNVLRPSEVNKMKHLRKKTQYDCPVHND